MIVVSLITIKNTKSTLASSKHGTPSNEYQDLGVDEEWLMQAVGLEDRALSNEIIRRMYYLQELGIRCRLSYIQLNNVSQHYQPVMINCIIVWTPPTVNMPICTLII